MSIPGVDDENAPYREDCTFVGWLLPDGSTTSEAKTIAELTDNYTRTDDLVLYALWKPYGDGMHVQSNNGNGREIYVSFDDITSYTFDKPAKFTKEGSDIHYFCTDPRGEYGIVFNVGQTVPVSELRRLFNENGGDGGMSPNNVQNPNATMNPQNNPALPLDAPLADGQGTPTPGNWVFDPIRGVWEFSINQANAGTAQAGGSGSSSPAGGSGSGSGSGGGGGAGGGSSARAAGGWYLINANNGNHWYNFDATGAMRTGFYEVAGKIYYLAMQGYEIGQMQTGVVLINGVYYYINPDGTLFSNGVTPEGLVVNEVGMIIG